MNKRTHEHLVVGDVFREKSAAAAGGPSFALFEHRVAALRLLQGGPAPQSNIVNILQLLCMIHLIVANYAVSEKSIFYQYMKFSNAQQL